MKDKILNHAVRLSASKGFSHVTRSQIAKSANVAPGLVSYYFKSMKGLQNSVMAEAVSTENLPIIAQGLIAKHPKAHAASDALKARALKHVTG